MRPSPGPAAYYVHGCTGLPRVDTACTHLYPLGTTTRTTGPHAARVPVAQPVSGTQPYRAHFATCCMVPTRTTLAPAAVEQYLWIGLPAAPTYMDRVMYYRDSAHSTDARGAIGTRGIPFVVLGTRGMYTPSTQPTAYHRRLVADHTIERTGGALGVCPDQGRADVLPDESAHPVVRPEDPEDLR